MSHIDVRSFSLANGSTNSDTLGPSIPACCCGQRAFVKQALRNKSFGSAMDFVWSSANTGDYAIRETIARVKTFKNFKEQV